MSKEADTDTTFTNDSNKLSKIELNTIQDQVLPSVIDLRTRNSKAIQIYIPGSAEPMAFRLDGWGLNENRFAHPVHAALQEDPEPPRQFLSLQLSKEVDER